MKNTHARSSNSVLRALTRRISFVLFFFLVVSVSKSFAGAEGHGNDSFRDRLEEAQKVALGHIQSATEKDLKGVLGEKPFQMFFSRKDRFIEKAISVTPDKIQISEVPIFVLVNGERKAVEARTDVEKGTVEFSRSLCSEHSLSSLVYIFLHEVGHLAGYDDHFEQELSNIALGLLTVKVTSSDTVAIKGLKGELLNRFRQMTAHVMSKPLPDFSPFFEIIREMQASLEYQTLNHEGRCRSQEKCDNAAAKLKWKWVEALKVSYNIKSSYEKEWQNQYDRMSEDCSQWGQSFSDFNQGLFVAASSLQLSVAISDYSVKESRLIWDRIHNLEDQAAETEKRGKPIISFIDFLVANVPRVCRDELSEEIRREKASFSEKAEAILKHIESLTPFWEKE